MLQGPLILAERVMRHADASGQEQVEHFSGDWAIVFQVTGQYSRVAWLSGVERECAGGGVQSQSCH